MFSCISSHVLNCRLLNLIRKLIPCIFQNVEVEEEHVDERSVDDLLSFINGNDGGRAFLSLFFS